MAYIEIKDVSKDFIQKGEVFRALNHISLSIEKGEFICILGPSGCGKTTLLNIMAGFEKISEGNVTIDGKKVRKPSPNHVTIFQNYGLLPWRTVRRNVELGLERQKIPSKERRETAEKYIELVGLSDFAENHPYQLSGGMQQRVAIARALAVDPDIIFMDEPFGALDAITRIKMQEDILSISRSQKKTIIFVTHSIEEAIFLADRIVVMKPNPGRVKEIVPVKLKHKRDRTEGDFLAVRDKVFDLFEMQEKEALEFFIAATQN